MLKLLLYVSLIACVFAPWGLAIADAGRRRSAARRRRSTSSSSRSPALLLGVFETSIAKMRVFRVPDFLGAALMLGLLGALLLFVSRSLK